MTTAEELRGAVFARVPHQQDRAVQQQTGVGKTTVNDLRRGTRRFTRDSLDKLVSAYDPAHRDQWLAALARTQQAPEPDEPGTADPAEPEPEPEGGHASSVKPFLLGGLTGSLVTLVLAVLVVTLLGGRSGTTATPTTAGQAPGLPGAGCPHPALETQAPVAAEAGAAQADVGVVALSYTYYPAYSPQIEIGGGLSGAVPAGHRLFLLSWSDPASHDSTPGRNPGNGRYYPSPELTLTAQHCFHVAKGEMGYGGFTGMRQASHLVLVPEAQAKTFERDGVKNGYTRADLVGRGVVWLGSTTVQTR